MKRLEEMDDHELLMELVNEKRRNDRLRYLNYALIALLLIAVGLLLYRIVPRFMEMYQGYQNLVQRFDAMEESASEFIRNFNASGYEKIQETVDKIAEFLKKIGF